MTKHRATCDHPDCRRVWRENCVDCLTEVADRHTAETGHPVHRQITTDDTPVWELREMTRRAHPVLYSPKRGW